VSSRIAVRLVAKCYTYLYLFPKEQLDHFTHFYTTM